MSDLEDYLSFSEISKFHKLPAQLRLWRVSANDIITLNPAEIAKRTNCSASAIVNIRGAIVRALLKKEGHERERIREESLIVEAELRPLLEARKARNDHNYEEFKRLAPDEHRKRKSSEEIEEEELEELKVMEAVEELGDDPGIPQSMKKNKRRRVTGTTYQEARKQHDEMKTVPIPTPQSTRRILFQETGQEVDDRWRTVGLLDRQLTRALSGGIAPGYITEVCGESGCGKTQLMLHLLLAVQLPEPIGLSKSAVYLSTESGLPTKRVRQLLAEHPLLAQPGPHPQMGKGAWPSLDNIYTQEINSLEVQERIMEHMVPLLIKRKNIGLVVVDSLTGNYRQEFSNPELGFKENMMRRAKTMRRLGALLREYAKCGVAVVVVNQVSDRFDRDEEKPSDVPSSTAELAAIYEDPSQHGTLDTIIHDTNLSAIHNRLLGYVPPSHAPGTEVPDEEAETNIALQEQFFSGWGDDPYDQKNMKNPWGGISWTKQLSCRIALIKQLDREANDGSWKRWAKVVFCAWSPNSGIGLRHKAVEYKITTSGIQSCGKEYAEPRTPPTYGVEDPHAMEDPAVEEAFLELERNWKHQYWDVMDEKQEAVVQIQELKMQEPILMTQALNDVRATHITFDEMGEAIANEVLALPRLSPTSGVGQWNRRTGAASSPLVPQRRLHVDEVADTQAETQADEEAASDVEHPIVDINHLPIPPMMPKTRNGAPDPHSDSSDDDDDDDLPNDNDPKNGDEGEPPPLKRFGSEVPDSQAESMDGSDYEHMFVEKNSVERQWEADHHVEEATHVQITDSVEPEDNFLHPHSSQEIQAREAKKAEEEKGREERGAKSPTPSAKPDASIGHVPKAAVEDDAFVPSRPYGEAIRTSEERTNELVELTSTMPAPTQPDESASKKERRAAKKARKEARKAKKAAKPDDNWTGTPEAKRFKECIGKYPFVATRDAHNKAMAEQTNLGAKAQLQGAYELMCVKRAREHNLTLLDWPVAQTPEGEYIDVETGFLMTEEDADCVLGIGQIESSIGNFFSPMRRQQAEEAENGDGADPTTPSRRARGETPSSAQPRESMMPESPPKKETPIPPPKTWSEKQAVSAEKRSPAPILPGAKPPFIPPSTPSRPRKVTGSLLSSLPRKEGAILPGMKPPTPIEPPASQESPLRKVTPVLPPSSPLPFIPDVPDMKRMKKRLPGSQLKQVMNSSDAIEPPQMDDDEPAKNMSVEVVPDQENAPRSSVPLRSSPPPSMAPPSSRVAQIQALSPDKARARYSPQQRKRSQLQETYTHSSAPNPSYHPHHRSDFEDISQEDATPASPERPRDPPILPGMKPTKPLPVYKTPKHSHKKKEKPLITPATPLRPDQLPKEGDIDYDALFPSQGESQESPQKQVFIMRQGVKYPVAKPGKDFYGAGRSKEVQYPPTKGQRDAEEADRIAANTPQVGKEVLHPPTKGQRNAAEAEEADRIRQEVHAHSTKKRVIFKNQPIRALDSPDFDTDAEDGEAMADILNFAAFKQTTPKKQHSGGFLALTSSPHRPTQSAPKSASAKTFHATSIENATITKAPKYSSKPSKRWQEVQREIFKDVTPGGSFEAVIPSSQPEADDVGGEGVGGLHTDEVETDVARKNGGQEFETTASDDEYGFNAEMLEAMNEIVVPPSATQKRQRADSLGKDLPNCSAKRMRSGEHTVKATQPMGLDGAADISPHRAGAQKMLSSETNIAVTSPSRQRTSNLFERIKAAKAQGLPYPPPAPLAPVFSSRNGYVDGMGVYRPPSSQHGGPSKEFCAPQTRSSGTIIIDKDGSRTWRPETERPLPSIERDEEDIVWETNALKEQAEREMKEAEEREEAASQRAKVDRELGRVDPGWLYISQEQEEMEQHGGGL